MLRNLLIAAAAVAALATPAMAQIKMGVAAEPYPPFTVKNAAGVWEGWEIDLMNAVCAEMGEECVIVDTAWDGIIPALQAGQIDVIWSSMSITAERDEQIDFSNKYYNTPAAIIGLKSETMDLSPAGMTGKVIGVQVSTIHGNYAKEVYGAVAEIKEYATFDEHNADLAAGRLDAAVGDSLAFDPFLKSDAGKDMEIKTLITDREDIFGIGVGGGVRTGDPLKAKIDAALEAVRASGKYDEITKKYFDFDIYGG